MSIWSQLERLAVAAGRRTIGPVFEALQDAKARREEEAFSIALIALSAKLAKADGLVTDDEIAAFRDFFEFSDADASKVRMIYDLAKQDVAGFEHYLARVARLFEASPAVLEDVLDCLHHVALADGVAHPNEIALLDQAAAAFGLAPHVARRVRAAHIGLGEEDPYAILGIDPGADEATLKARYRELVRKTHPDALVARGVPASLVKIAEGRTAAINDAYARSVA
ncbi:MAG: TerB family tellurite resistance protein [Parvularculaceae bacterium]